MEWFSIIGSVASILGLVVATWTLLKVGTITTALKQHSRDRQLAEMIDKNTRVPRTKPTLPDATATDLEIVLKTIRLYYVSRLPLRHRNLKLLIHDLEVELRGEKRLVFVQHQLRLIRDEVTLR